MTPKKQNYINLANTLMEKFKHRGIEGHYCDSKEEVLALIQEMLIPGCTVSYGGSMTIEELGIIDLCHSLKCTVYDRGAAKTPEEERRLFGLVVTTDYYFMSSNAITMDGELVNIDGNGNRVACLIHGPENVVVVAGMNKICPDLESAVKRVRNIAAPPNGVRLNRKTPCAKIGKCADCLSPDCMCCQMVITRKSFHPSRIKVILVGEEYGY